MNILRLWVFVPVLLLGRDNDPCTDLQSEGYWASSPVYVEAHDLAQKLQSAGIQVQCIRRSKEEHLFDGQAGAAWFKTDQGAFEVWFLPEADSFNGLHVIEQSTNNGRFLYSFTGMPRISTTFDSSRRMWFIQQRNVLFEIWGDSKLAARISIAFRRE